MCLRRVTADMWRLLPLRHRKHTALATRREFVEYPNAERLGPRSASYILRSAGDVSAAANAGQSGQGTRTKGSVHVPGSRTSTHSARISFDHDATRGHNVGRESTLHNQKPVRGEVINESPSRSAARLSNQLYTDLPHNREVSANRSFCQESLPSPSMSVT
jgi:hypothetical protein